MPARTRRAPAKLVPASPGQPDLANGEKHRARRGHPKAPPRITSDPSESHLSITQGPETEPGLGTRIAAGWQAAPELGRRHCGGGGGGDRGESAPRSGESPGAGAGDHALGGAAGFQLARAPRAPQQHPPPWALPAGLQRHRLSRRQARAQEGALRARRLPDRGGGAAGSRRAVTRGGGGGGGGCSDRDWGASFRKGWDLLARPLPRLRDPPPAPPGECRGVPRPAIARGAPHSYPRLAPSVAGGASALPGLCRQTRWPGSVRATKGAGSGLLGSPAGAYS